MSVWKPYTNTLDNIRMPEVVVTTNGQRIAVERSLNDVMSFGHVIHVAENGTVTDGDDMPAKIYGNEVVYLILDDDGQSLDDDYQDIYAGWSAFTAGYTSQHGYRGPTMHSCESIGGRLARDILTTPGYYVAVVVDGEYADDRDTDGEDVNIGWAVLRHE